MVSGHSDVITLVDAIYLDDNIKYPGLLVVTASADSTVKVWLRNSGTSKCNFLKCYRIFYKCTPSFIFIPFFTSDEVTCIQTLRSGSGLYTSVKLCILPRNNIPLLAVASDDAKIHLYTVIVEVPTFHLVHTLIGHEDWVRSLDFAIHGNKISSL